MLAVVDLTVYVRARLPGDIPRHVNTSREEDQI